MKRWHLESILGRREREPVDPPGVILLAISVAVVVISFALWVGSLR